MDIITPVIVLPLALLPAATIGVAEVIRVIRAKLRNRYPRRACAHPDATVTTALTVELEHQEMCG